MRCACALQASGLADSCTRESDSRIGHSSAPTAEPSLLSKRGGEIFLPRQPKRQTRDETADETGTAHRHQDRTGRHRPHEPRVIQGELVLLTDCSAPRVMHMHRPRGLPLARLHGNGRPVPARLHSRMACSHTHRQREEIKVKAERFHTCDQDSFCLRITSSCEIERNVASNLRSMQM